MVDKFDDIGVVEVLEDLKFSIFVSFILEDLFDSDCLLGFVDFGLKNEENWLLYRRHQRSRFLLVVLKW